MLEKTKNALFLICIVILLHQTESKFFRGKFKFPKKSPIKIPKPIVVEKEEPNPNICRKPGFGLSGTCINSVTGASELSISKDVDGIVNDIIMPVLHKITGASHFCTGDFPANEIMGDQKFLADATCEGIPLMDGLDYGVVAATTWLPCPALKDVSFCFVFDQCGTVALSLNGNAFACMATYMTGGFASALTAVSDVMTYGTIGFSYNKKFEKTFRLAYRHGSSVKNKEVTTRGHIQLGLGLGFPFDLKIGSKSLEDFVEIGIKSTILIDFGDVESVVKTSINAIKKLDPNGAKKTLRSIINSGAECTQILDGSVTFKFEDLTQALIPDMTLELGKVALLVSLGKGRSGMKPGFYGFFDTDPAGAIVQMIEGLLEHFKSILKKIGVGKIPKIPSTGLQLGIFIQTDSMGFFFKSPNILSAKCMFIYSSKKGSCEFNSKLFTAIIKAGKWVIKKAGRFFEDTGEEIAEFGVNVKNWGAAAAKSIADKAKKAAEAAARAAREAAERARREAERKAKELAAKAKKAACKAKCSFKLSKKKRKKCKRRC